MTTLYLYQLIAVEVVHRKCWVAFM